MPATKITIKDYKTALHADIIFLIAAVL